MLGSHDVLETKGWSISLNSNLVWIDAVAFDHLTGANDGAEETDTIRKAVDLYWGNLLPEDNDEPWSMPLRERLRGKFVHHLGRLSKTLEDDEQWERAGALYLRGIDADPLSETFYRGLMRCHLAHGQCAEGVGVYRRLSQVLSGTSGLKPSAETEAVHQLLLG